MTNRKEYMKEYKRKHKKELDEYAKWWRFRNAEKIRKQRREQYRKKCMEKLKKELGKNF